MQDLSALELEVGETTTPLNAQPVLLELKSE